MKDSKATYGHFNAVMKDWGLTHKRRAKALTSEPTRIDQPANARAPRTAITFGWLTGDPGPLHIQYGHNQISEADVEWANSTHGNEINVRVLDKKSHMNDRTSFIDWLRNEVKLTFRKRGLALKIDFERTGMLIADPGPCHICWAHGAELERDAIMKEMNVMLVFLAPGSSAHGQWTKSMATGGATATCLQG